MERETRKPVHQREFTMDVRVGLREEEREPLVKEAFLARKDWTELTAEAANVAATYRKRLKGLADQLDEALLTLNQGRPTPRVVIETRNYRKLTVVVKDKETGVIYTDRPMTDEDAQTTIPDHPNGVEEEGVKPRARDDEEAA